MDAASRRRRRLEGPDLHHSDRSRSRQRGIHSAHDCAVLNAGLHVVIGRLTGVIATRVVGARRGGRRVRHIHRHRPCAMLMRTALCGGRRRCGTKEKAHYGQYGEQAPHDARENSRKAVRCPRL